MTNLPGIAQWFRMGEKEIVERTIKVLNDLRIGEFRVLFSWADWESPGGPEWFDFFVSAIGSRSRAKLIPDLFYTPLSKARKDDSGMVRTSHPPLDLADYARFTETMIERYGKYFDWIQLWNEPNWKPYWEWDLDPDAALFSSMAGGAADVAHRLGKNVALGGLSPYEPQWITLIHGHGLLAKLDAIGMHYSPSWNDQRRKWYGWNTELSTARAHLKGLGASPEVWIAETGVASPDDQIAFFDETCEAHADKTIWFSVLDQARDHRTDNEINMAGRIEEAAYNFGLITTDGKKKSLYEHWRILAHGATHE